MNLFFYILNFSLIFCVTNASELPVGVNPSNKDVYNPSGNFKCLDGLITISFDKVNDDYCDCMDGSDEPGTSACPNGIFYCPNKGYKPTLIPSSRVGDGVCDCCDGSDEYTGLISCKNNCMVLGEEMRAANEKKQQLIEEGFKIYQEYVEEGTAAKNDKKSKLSELEVEKKFLESEKERLDGMRKEAEIPEEEAKNKHKHLWEESKSLKKIEKRRQLALEAFTEIDSDLDGRITVSDMQTRLEFDVNEDGEVSREEALEYLKDNDDVEFVEFFEKIWDNIESIFKKASTQSNEETKEEPATDLPVEEDDERSYGGDDEDEEDENNDDDSHVNRKTTENYDRGSDDDNEPMPPYDEETQKLVSVADEARNALHEVESKLKNIQIDIDEANAVVDSDFGSNNEFYHLRNQCYDWSDREYMYKLCPFSKATQSNKHGGSETNLGYWKRWSDNGDKYLSMIYENGQNCWNGPDRSTKVLIECGLTNELTSASEPNRCEYQFTFITPAACSIPSDQLHTTTPHGEL